MTQNKGLVGTLVDHVRADSETRKRAAADQLWEVLLRNDKPKTGDEERLADAIGTLGINAESLPEILEIVQTLARSEQLVAELDERRQAAGQANRELTAVDDWVAAEHERIAAEADAKRQPLQRAKADADRRLRDAEEARRMLGNYRAKWFSLVDGISFEAALEAVRPPRGIPHGAPR